MGQERLMKKKKTNNYKPIKPKQTMSITAKNESKPIELAPAGNHIARCYSMVHIGTIKETIRGEVKELNKVRISWELPTEKKIFNSDKGEEPFSELNIF